MLPTYWNTPFSKICLGMKIGQQINFIVINKSASSLYSLIADGQYRATSLGRNTWKFLLGSRASLQPNCNKEGFNVNEGDRARIGILGNNENDCNSCDSRIGFGTGGYPDDSNTCGNENGSTHIKAIGYIFVQWVLEHATEVQFTSKEALKKLDRNCWLLTFVIRALKHYELTEDW